jgi:hypothetical protein
MVGRDFPPFENTHVRVSMGTMAEMSKATAVFRDVLRRRAGSGGSRGGRRRRIRLTRRRTPC